MSTLQVVRAWKDQSYRNSLSADQLAKLPAHPSGTIEFDRTAVAVKTNGSKCPSPYTLAYCTVGRAMLGSTCA